MSDKIVMTEAERLAEEHWAWLRGLLLLCGVLNEELERHRYLYISTFIHGYKHAKDGE